MFQLLLFHIIKFTQCALVGGGFCHAYLCLLTQLIYFTYEYIFHLWIAIDLCIHCRHKIISNSNTLYTFPQHHTDTKICVAPIFTTLKSLTKMWYCFIYLSFHWVYSIFQNEIFYSIQVISGLFIWYSLKLKRFQH